MSDEEWASAAKSKKGKGRRSHEDDDDEDDDGEWQPEKKSKDKGKKKETNAKKKQNDDDDECDEDESCSGDSFSDYYDEEDFKPKKQVCQFGKECYRKNPKHFEEYDHPWLTKGDTTSKAAESKSGKPVCAYGKECYRKNPKHFEEFDHPWTGTPVKAAASSSSSSTTATPAKPSPSISSTTTGASAAASSSSSSVARAIVPAKPSPPKPVPAPNNNNNNSNNNSSNNVMKPSPPKPPAAPKPAAAAIIHKPIHHFQQDPVKESGRYSDADLAMLGVSVPKKTEEPAQEQQQQQQKRKEPEKLFQIPALFSSPVKKNAIEVNGSPSPHSASPGTPVLASSPPDAPRAPPPVSTTAAASSSTIHRSDSIDKSQACTQPHAESSSSSSSSSLASLALPILCCDEVHGFNLDVAASVAADNIKKFIAEHNSIKFKIVVVDTSEAIKTLKKKLGCDDGRVVLLPDGNISALESDHHQGCKVIAMESNWRLRQPSQGRSALIHLASNSTLQKLAIPKAPAKIGDVVDVSLPHDNVFRTQQGVESVLHVVVPNMNPDREDCLQENDPMASKLLSTCYANMFK